MAEEPRWMETEGKKAAPEGPHLFKKEGYYYFVMAASSGLFNGHHMLVARSKNVYGPYENSPNNPYLTQRDPNAVNFHLGHGKIFITQNGEWWTMILSQRRIPGEIRGRKTGISQLGRETSLERITWDENGWPVANGGKGPLDAGVIADAAFLSDQGTPNWGFMGMMTGIYSFNRGTGKRIPADFDFFRIEPDE